ncbi:hypothetical protein HPP92_002398 [Vanilla planifolia]|uniref:biotin synthase n=1 Tax=Vanilla planifolia TaxID=51239 RepID=A0A835S1Q2_VANPL|nr:hypothetical protein HPP92_002398 [Vanilla planifolia]
MLLCRPLRISAGFRAARFNFSTSSAAVEAERTIREGSRNDWSKEEIKSVYDSPILDLLFHGAQVHRHAHKFSEVQQCTLLSIKTGGCSEDCSYCPQSSREMGMEVCCTLGMLEKQQAIELKKAGLTAYNHNLDTSREYYPNIITTRSYDERLETLQYVHEAGISVCSGGIIGLGETEEDRVGLLHTLATLPVQPESVPINALVAVKGTPLQHQKPVEIWEMIRMIATARIAMPKAMVRLSAGRVRFSIPEQALCFLAGANSIFTGEKLLTTQTMTLMPTNRCSRFWA